MHDLILRNTTEWLYPKGWPKKKHYAYKKRVHIVDSSGLNIAISETHSIFDIPST